MTPKDLPELPIVAFLASYTDTNGAPAVYVTSHEDLAIENDAAGKPEPLVRLRDAIGGRSTAAQPADIERLVNSFQNYCFGFAQEPRNPHTERRMMDARKRLLAAVAASGDSTPPSEPAVWPGAAQTWKWMTHPHWNEGFPIPVLLTTDPDSGEVWYQPFSTSCTDFEWACRDKEWAEVAAPVQGDPSGALRQQPEAVGQGRWQPMETAPRDGTEIWAAQAGAHECGVIAWDDDLCRWQDLTDDYEEPNWQPTHWQPLPEPPQAASVERGD